MTGSLVQDYGLQGLRASVFVTFNLWGNLKGREGTGIYLAQLKLSISISADEI
jgi:hypothetical protein